MAKAFLIVPLKTIKVRDVNKILDKLMSNKKIKISSKNYVVIGNDEKIIFDISNHIIKGKFLNGAAEKEKDVVKQLILNMGTERIYMHFYGNNAFLKKKNMISI